MINISVVISTCNRYESILSTLHSVLNNTVKPLEVLVIDQSDDRERMTSIIDSVSNKMVRCMFLDHKGASIGRNAGLRQSSGEIIAFTDDDAYVREDWLERTLQTFAEDRYRTGIAGGEIIPVYEETNPNWTIPKQWEYVLPAYSQEGPIAPFSRGYPPGVNYAIRRELVQTVGYFDEKLGPMWGRKNQLFGEDTNYTLRALRAGYEVVYNPESVVYHPVPLSRQTQDFLNSRLFAKGLTDIAVDYRLDMPGKTRMLVDYFNRLSKLLGPELAKTRDKRIKEGKRSLLKGQLAMIKAYLFHSDVFESKLF